jgi:hypothetical protein
LYSEPHFGNPDGRPKTKPFRDRVMGRVEQAKGSKDIDQIVEPIFKKAKQGEVWAITMLVDRVDGKVPGSFGRVDESSDLAPIARVLRIFGCPRKMSEAEKRRRTPTSTSFERKGARHEGGQPE